MVMVQNKLYDNMDLPFVHSHSFANIPDVTVQIITNAQQDREGNILALVELTHCSGSKT